jgi:hypothetical protein
MMKCSEKISDLCYLPPKASLQGKALRPKDPWSVLKNSLTVLSPGAEEKKEVMLGIQGRNNREQKDKEPI